MIFRTLMATRATRLSAEHVQALNGIELTFYGGGKKEKKVLEAWKAYHDHLNTKYEGTAANEWTIRQIDLFIALLFEMAVCLGYEFDRTSIKNSWYAPQAHETIEQDWHTIRTGLADVLEGKRSLPVTGYAANEEEANQTSEMRRLLIDWLKENKNFVSSIKGQNVGGN